MLIYLHERRRRRGSLYAVRTLYLFGLVALYSRWDQLTTSRELTPPGERGG